MQVIKPGTLQFYQIFPDQTLPRLARAVAAPSPKRAKLFCPPFQSALNTGVLFYPPINFDVYVDDDAMQMRVNADTDDETIVTVHKATATSKVNYLLLQDVSKSRSERCLAEYRRRLAECTFPAWLNPDNFGFYEIMVNGLYEADIDAFFLQVWLGGVIQTAPGEHVWVKHPSNRLNPQPYSCLDGIVATDQWQGWFAVVLRIERTHTWVQIRTDEPICQMIPCAPTDYDLTVIEAQDTPTDIIQHPVEWHMLDPTYGRKPGKYQRQLKAASDKPT